MSKGGAIVAFEPGGAEGYSSLPGIMAIGFAPLPKGDALYEEAMDCLCDSGPKGSMDFREGNKKKAA